MLKLRQILVSRVVLAGVAVAFGAAAIGCGQRGPLYLPTEPAAAQRATLPEVLNPRSRETTPAPPQAVEPATAPLPSAPTR